MEQVLTFAMEAHWNKKLSGKFALAPRNWEVKDEELYRRYSDEYSAICSNYVETELTSMAKELGKQALAFGTVSVFGIGLARGLDFIPIANGLNMHVELYDISNVAINFAHKKLRELNVNGMNAIHKQEISGEEGEFNVQDSMLLYMANFLQILPRERMIAVGKSVGRWLQLPHRRAVIVHPSEQGNEAAMWGDTTPYTKAELLAPISEGLGHPIRIAREGQDIDYFGCHKYSIFTIAR